MSHYLKKKLYDLIKKDARIFDDIQEIETSLLAEMLDIAPNSITIHDNTGKFLYANQKTFEIHGYSMEEFLDLNLQSLDVPESAELIEERINAIQKNGHAKFEVEHLRKDGTTIPLEVYVKMVDWKGTQAMLSIAKDISERRMIEQFQNKYKQIISSTPDGIAMLDREYRYTIVNDAYEKYSNRKTSELIGMSVDEHLGEQLFLNEIKPRFDKCLSGETIKYQMWVNYPTLGKRYMDITYFPIFADKEKIEGVVAVTKDATDMKLLQDSLISSKEKAEKANRLKTEFLNNMSHEIRTPMNGIIGFSDLLNKPDISDEKRNSYTKIIQNSSQQLLRIIDDILEISTLETKQDTLNEEILCLNDFMMELFSIFNLKSKERSLPLYIKKALSDTESQIVSDKTKLNKILGNLLENALKYTNKGFIEMGYYLKEKNLILYVKDTGIGISPKNHQLVFERFSQEDREMSRKHGGLGLGLSIARENARLLGGSITLESDKGAGSTFYVSLPYKPSKTESASPAGSQDKSKAAATKGNCTILVAEDEEVNYLFIEALFQEEGAMNCNMIHAKNGKEAVEICMNNNIDLILMDIKMPVMNGHEATAKIKSMFPKLPVIAQTAYSSDSDKELAFKHGCDDFISKPLNTEELFGLIAKHITWK